MVAEGGEGENPLPFSLTAPKRGGGWGGGGGRGGIPASFPSRSPPPKQPFQPTPTPSPPTLGGVLDGCRRRRGCFLSPLQPQNARGVGGGGVGGVSRLRFPRGKGPKPLAGRASSPGGPGPKPPGDLAHRPTLTDFLQAKFLTSCCVSNP